jgi:hypothetical protein
MAIPVSGPLSISQFNTELGRTSTEANSQLAGASTPQVGSLVYIAGQLGTLNQTAPFAFSNWYGYTQSGGGTTTTTTTTTTTSAPTTTTTTTSTTTTTTTAAPTGIFLVGSSQSTGSTSITLPTGLAQNDLVFIMSTSNSASPTLPTGYTNGQNGTNGNCRYRWAYKRMGATPDTTATNITSAAITIAFVYRNVNLTTIFNATASSATGGSGMPNAPTRTSTLNNCMFVALGFLADDAVTATAPANYTLVRTANYAGGTSMAAERLLAVAGASDPAAFGGGGSDDWFAVQFALRPV